MKKYLVLIVFLFLPLMACSSAPKGELTVKVLDASNNSISGAEVWVGGFKGEGSTVKKTKNRGVTNREGEVELYGELRDIAYGVNANKEGYYASRKEVSVRSKESKYKKETKIVLRKKINPIPMYAKKTSPILPERSMKYGVDFFEGDLVVDGYSGKRKDILFNVERTRLGEKYEDYEQILTISFPGEKDGIQFFEVPSYAEDSEFKSHYKAPESGYEDEATIMIGRKDGHRYTENIRRPAYLRIRSTVDENGNLESAHYCKIYPGFFIGGAWDDTARVDVPFYCNPHKNDRGMEFDTGSSLFRDLKGKEQMRKP